ncbi:MAG: protein translocase subunit SecF [Patescibacteria group bacterium]|nr:protein translocase subunit SecF [Patescibacteria group bacterium]
MNINWLSYCKFYLIISLFFIISGLVGVFLWGLPLGIDFKGGVIAEYKFESSVKTDFLIVELSNKGVSVSAIQPADDGNYIFKIASSDNELKDSLDKYLKEIYPDLNFEQLRFESVGPSIGPEMIRKTFYAVLISSIAILLWVAYQFRNFRYGLSAIIAMLHDTFILVSSFAFFGRFWGATVDFLFVTAVLTTLSFSVHDTIVVFDRIRELKAKAIGDISEVANLAINQTMVRSLNNSFTIIFMLFALILFGGSSVFWFAIALLVGTIAGTYSSPFVAVPVLVYLTKLKEKKF